MATILRLENVSKHFAGLVAVDKLSLEMEERTIHSLIGPNGSGKSTSINLITGVLPLTEGKVYHRDIQISGMPTYKITRTGISRTFQNLKLFPSMTVKENLMVGRHMKTEQGLLNFLVNPVQAAREEKEMSEKADEILHYVGIYDIRNEYVNNIAYGRQKMTELGRALMNDPKLMLLDEPAAGLNPSERVEFVNILLKVFESGIDLFLIEHNMDVVMNISHRVTVINFGAKIAEGDCACVQDNPEVIKAYLGDRYKKNLKKEAATDA